MYILGINAYHPDSSACIVKDGKLIAAAEEERFVRIKHYAGFPFEAIRYCLKEAKISPKDLDYIGISRNPYAHLYRKFFFILKRRPKISFLKSRLDNLARIKNIKDTFCSKFSTSPIKLKAKVYNVEHHKAHLSSCFLLSDFEEAAILSLDAMGDFVSTMSGFGKKNRLKVLDRIFFPNSLGYLYTATTQFLGFLKFGDEYKVMALAAYGKPNYLDRFRDILRFEKNGKFSLNSEYFNFSSEGLSMSWDGKEPVCGILYSDKWKDFFGQPRSKDGELTQHHKDIASSLQKILEDAYFHILNYLYKRTKTENLCLAGGVALNSVANGKIFRNTPFKRIYIQPAANDAGTSLGAAYYIWNYILNKPRNFVMEHAYWGPQFSEAELSYALKVMSDELKKKGCKVLKIQDEIELCRRIAFEIADGGVVGWFQGRMEWAPRALGNRSILVDPRRQNMKDILNDRIKHRESFRPFAPSILEEELTEYLEENHHSDFMLLALPAKIEKISQIPACIHINGTARFQSVKKETNPLFWQLINEFKKLTGVAAVLNTSFNENEPIVCKPQEAIDCFLRTKMDVLVLGNYLIDKQDNEKKDEELLFKKTF